MDLKNYIRDVENFPKEGVTFRDISPLLGTPKAWQHAIDKLAVMAKTHNPTMLAGIDARGFLLAAPLAHQLGLGFAMVRKKGKLPWKTVDLTYDLEYGSDHIELHADAFPVGERVLICDDLLATGGTAAATKALIEKCGAHPVGLLCLIELVGLKGRDRMGDLPIDALLTY